MASPTQRALAECKRLGYTAGIVEKWVPTPEVEKKGGPPGRRIDLFGCIDIVALDGSTGCLGIQVTSASNVASRKAKACREPRIAKWIWAGNRFEVWGYRKHKGDRRWHLTRWRMDPFDVVSEEEAQADAHD